MSWLGSRSSRKKVASVHLGSLLGALLAQVPLYAQAEGLMKKEWGVQSGYGVDAAKAWTQMRAECSKSEVVVAVIDTGIDMNHPALRNSLWTNKKELNGKEGVDNDGNGFVNDVHGWDFVRNTGKLIDAHGHGTHIAGIISGNTPTGGDDFRGVCPGVKIMALRYYDPNGSGEDNLKNTVRAIEYAVDNGATLINYSGGGAEYSGAEFAALKRAEKKGILVVAAAGNERSDADRNLYFPSAYNLTNIISVTAIDDKGQVLPSSNYGVKKVHVAAPGQSILSSLPNGGYGFMSGTSQATAFVSGIAALLFTENGKFSVDRVKSIVENSAQKYPQLAGKTKTGAKVSAYNAVQMARGRRVISSTPTSVKPASTSSPKDLTSSEARLKARASKERI